MQMLYDSRQYVVGAFVVRGDAEAEATPALSRGGYEIVDKTARREIFIEGALAERFQQGVQELVQTGTATEENFDDYIAGFATMAQHPLVLH